MISIANTIQMSFSVPESDKKNAQSAEEYLFSLINLINIGKEHLNIIQSVFQKFENISADKIHERRGILNRYKQQIKENFEKVLKEGVIANHFLEYFNSDSHIAEITNSLEEDIKNLEKNINVLLDTLDDYKDPSFRDNVIKAVQNIEKASAQVEQLIRDRIIEYLDDNILSKNWKSNTMDQFDIKFDEKKPMLIQIFDDMKKGIGNPQIAKRQQSLNPSDNQRASTPTDIRDNPEHDDVGKNTYILPGKRQI